MRVLRTVSEWRLRTRSLELGARTLVMGVVNITPDSFSDGGVSFTREDAIARCLQCLGEGADILDLGGESTRPGSRAGGADAAVGADEEQARLLPVIDRVLAARPDAVISVDTYKAATANAVLAAGAEIINDVSGFTWDADIARVCTEANAGVILMHTRGKPDEWRTQDRLAGDEVLGMVRDGLSESLTIAGRAGIRRDSIVLDPGYGFGKRFGENYGLLARQAELLSLGYPLLAGVSRKSFLGNTLASLHGGEVAALDQRENASLAAMVAAILQGASTVRVHSVRAAVEAARIADAVLDAE